MSLRKMVPVTDAFRLTNPPKLLHILLNPLIDSLGASNG